MLITFIVTLIILAVCMLLLAIKVLFKKNGTFPNLHIGGNKAMAAKGIACARTQDKERLRHRNLEQRLKEIEV